MRYAVTKENVFMPEMRRSDKQLPNEAVLRLLNTAQVGTLALCGEDGPYLVPINFAFRAGEIFFHSASEGYKLRCIDRDSRAAFNVVNAPVLMAEQYTFKYQSVTASGTIEYITDEAQKRDALLLLAHKYCGNDDARHNKIINAEMGITRVFKLVCRHITGKGVPMD